MAVRVVISKGFLLFADFLSRPLPSGSNHRQGHDNKDHLLLWGGIHTSREEEERLMERGTGQTGMRPGREATSF